MFKKWKARRKETTTVSNIDDQLYNWKYIDVNELDQYPDAIHDIYDKQFDGMIIRNVFSHEEIALMRQRIEGMDQSKMTPTNGGAGHAHPRVFAQVARPAGDETVSREHLKAYFDGCASLPEELTDLLGVDFTERLESIFVKISGGRNIAVPSGFDGEGKYANTTIRMNHPGKGFINVHSGNYFQQEFPEFYEHLNTEVNVKDQLSYFITVNPAQAGGELTLFDLLWEPGQTKENANKDYEVFLTDGTRLDTGPNSPLKRMMVKPGPGDLLIFSGGPIWHKVELVEGDEERITIGGFLSFTSDMTTIKYWS